jgi:hypothetical protein
VALKCADAAALADAQAGQIANVKTLAQEFAVYVEGLGVAGTGAAVADARVQAEASGRPPSAEEVEDEGALGTVMQRLEDNRVEYCPGRRGRLSAISVSLCKSVLYMGLLYGRAGRLNTKKTPVSGPGQTRSPSATCSTPA